MSEHPEHQSKQERMDRLEKALDEATDVGIYPQSVIGGSNPYEKRTDWMEGWNAALMEVQKRICAALSDVTEQKDLGNGPDTLNQSTRAVNK